MNARTPPPADQNEADPLVFAWQELWHNAHLVRKYYQVILDTVGVADEAILLLAAQESEVYHRTALRHIATIRAAWRARLGMSETLSIDKSAFAQKAAGLSAIWSMASDAALRDEPNFVELHCNQARSATREAFSLARKFCPEEEVGD